MSRGDAMKTRVFKNISYQPIALAFPRKENKEWVRHLRKDPMHPAEDDVLVFRGDVVHAGSWYEQENLRIHAYVDVEGASRRANVTYIIRDQNFMPIQSSLCTSCN